ncbi:MAG: carbohydrate-binding protein, partial [Deltaproteobacteria bacterium]|nr:carbohydrate-binding protein [Deltaproteobacteria bacterium]
MKKTIFTYRHFLLACLLGLAVPLATCQTDDTGGARIKLEAPLRVDVNGPYSITVEVNGLNPQVQRNISCNGDSVVILGSYSLQMRLNGGNGKWIDMPDAEADFYAGTVTATIPEKRQTALRPMQRYDLQLVSPNGQKNIRPRAILIVGTYLDSDTGEDSQPYVFDPHIEAECVFGSDTGDCNGMQEGFASTDVIDVSATRYAPGCESDCTIVVDMIPDAYVAYNKIYLDGVKAINIRYAGDASKGYFDFVLDDKDTGDLIGSMNTYTSGLDTWRTQSVPIPEYTGAHILYIIGGADVDDFEDNGHIDWIELVYAINDTAADTDTGTGVGTDTGTGVGTDTGT